MTTFAFSKFKCVLYHVAIVTYSRCLSSAIKTNISESLNPQSNNGFTALPLIRFCNCFLHCPWTVWPPGMSAEEREARKGRES